MKFLNYGVSKKSRKLGIKPYSKRKIPPAYLQGDINQKKFTLEVSGVFPRETKKIPSLNSGDFSPCIKKEKNVCIVLFTRPNSRQGEIFLINLASEVPPVVENLGLILVIFLIIFFAI